MIKHLKARRLIASAILIISFINNSTVLAYDAPTDSVENKSVNEQVCSQFESSDIGEHIVNATGCAAISVNVLAAKNTVKTTNEGNLKETQTIDYNKEGWTTVNVNVRQEPNEKSKILDLYVYNTQINYIDYNEDWVQIEYNNDIAFISKQYVSNEKTVMINFYSYSGSVLTPNSGVNYGPSGKETYYNLYMGHCIYYMQQLGYNYNYWIRYDGVKMYGDYVMIATNTNIRPKGTILQTSLGLGIVCDHCEAAEGDYSQIDVATSW